MRTILLAGVFWAGLLPQVFAAQPAAVNFDDVIRKSGPLSPEDERQTLHVPPGFEVQLVASEPEINKPINLSFDGAGRLWCTSTVEYPFPAKEGQKARDSIKILSNFDASGKARTVTTFADGLNIPIGVLPYKNGAIGHSIPFIYSFQDTAGTGTSDKHSVLLDRISCDKDTHGMSGNFLRGFDGWIYATHGFNNTSTVKALDGSSITMTSGNTYRFRPDGSHIEQYTFGQVNPFGLAVDALGNVYSADCHTKPLYQLLRQGCYPSFGRKDDGLGFAPAMMEHLHGSTAIGGIVVYSDTRFPAGFRNNAFVGNVMTCKINRDLLVDTGTTRIAHEQPDFLSADDPWFRPVCMQLGPDGAIYVADFYNRIIGHYEVALTHPGRDRERGRIWRIVYKGPLGKPLEDALPPDLTKKSVDELIALMGSENLSLRLQAQWQLTDRIGSAAIEPLKVTLKSASPARKISALWGLFNLNALDEAALVAAGEDGDEAVRTHAMKILEETRPWNAALTACALKGLAQPSPWVQRAAAEALGQHPSPAFVKPLLGALSAADGADTHKVQVLRIALRNQMLEPGSAAKILELGLTESELAALAPICLGAHSEDSAAVLVAVLRGAKTPPPDAAKYLQHAIDNIPFAAVDALVAMARERFASGRESALALLKSIQSGAAKRGMKLSTAVRTWAAEVVIPILSDTEKPAAEWTALKLDGTPNAENPWVPQTRVSSDGKSGAFLSSLVRGEKLTGIYRSPPFTAPLKLSFFLAGHNGLPPAVHPAKNKIRLLDAASRETLREALPPRNDTAQRVEWDLAQFPGRSCVLELIDGDDADAYAWMAAGRFDPAVVPLPQAADTRNDELLSAIKLCADFNLAETQQPLDQIAGESTRPDVLRAAAVDALSSLDRPAHAAVFAALARALDVPPLVREHAVDALSGIDSPEARSALVEALKHAADKFQTRIAQSLSGTRAGGASLLDAIAAGQASPRLLFDKQVRERIAQSGLENADERTAKLTQGLQPPDQALQKTIDQRVKSYNAGKASVAQGAKVFEKNCMACHQLDGKGAVVGPQLDGVGARGLERLAEDVIDPSRNVDNAFHVSNVKLTSGQVFSGLKRREEGEQIVFADAKGVESSIAKKDIREIRETQMSLMPDGFAETIGAEDFSNLMAFLLSKTIKR